MTTLLSSSHMMMNQSNMSSNNNFNIDFFSPSTSKCTSQDSTSSTGTNSAYISNPFDDIINKLPFSDNEFVLSYDYETTTSGNSSDNDYGSFNLSRISPQNCEEISQEFKEKWENLLNAEFEYLNGCYFNGIRNLFNNVSRIKSYGCITFLVQELVKTFKLNETTKDTEYIMNLLNKIADPPMREMAGWLKDLRLHKYTPFFLSIKYETFLALSDDMLVEVGVTIGARRKILQSVNALKERISNCYQYDKIITEKDDLKSVIVFLKDLSLTPMQKYVGDVNESQEQIDGFNKPIELVNSDNLPGHFCRLLQKLYHLIVRIHRNEVDATYDTLDGKSFQMLDSICKRIQTVNAFTKNQKASSKEWQKYFIRYIPVNKNENIPPQKRTKKQFKGDFNHNERLNISVTSLNSLNKPRHNDWKGFGNSFSKDGTRYYRKPLNKKSFDNMNLQQKPAYMKKSYYIPYLNNGVNNTDELCYAKTHNRNNLELSNHYNTNRKNFHNLANYKSKPTRNNMNSAVTICRRDQNYISY